MHFNALQKEQSISREQQKGPRLSHICILLQAARNASRLTLSAGVLQPCFSTGFGGISCQGSLLLRAMAVLLKAAAGRATAML